MIGNAHDPVHHQHIGHRQLRVAGAEHLAMAAGEQLLALKGCFFAHWAVGFRG
jgi:hypothetical protein